MLSKNKMVLPPITHNKMESKPSPKRFFNFNVTVLGNATPSGVIGMKRWIDYAKSHKYYHTWDTAIPTNYEMFVHLTNSASYQTEKKDVLIVGRTTAQLFPELPIPNRIVIVMSSSTLEIEHLYKKKNTDQDEKEEAFENQFLYGSSEPGEVYLCRNYDQLYQVLFSLKSRIREVYVGGGIKIWEDFLNNRVPGFFPKNVFITRVSQDEVNIVNNPGWDSEIDSLIKCYDLSLLRGFNYDTLKYDSSWRDHFIIYDASSFTYPVSTALQSTKCSFAYYLNKSFTTINVSKY